MSRYRIYEVWEVQHPTETDHDFYEDSISPTFARRESAEAWARDYVQKAYDNRLAGLDEIIEVHERESLTTMTDLWLPDWTVAPGEILAEALEERGMSQAELGRRMARPLKTISEIVNGKAAITPDTAIQLERALDIAASVWLGLDLAKMRATVPTGLTPPPGKRGYRTTKEEQIAWRERALATLRPFKAWLESVSLEEWRTESATRARMAGYYLDQWIHEVEVRELGFELADGDLSDLAPWSEELT